MYLIIIAFVMCIPFVVWKIKNNVHSNFDEYSQKDYERRRKKVVQENLKQKDLDEQLKKEELARLQADEIKLKGILKKARDSCKDNQKLSKYDEILAIEVNKQEDLERIIFLFNNGDFRTEDEISEYNLYMKYEKNRKNFDTERHRVNFFAFFIPFTTVFCLVFFSSDYLRDLWFIGIPIALTAALFVGCIGMIIGYSVNISNAKVYGIPDNDERVTKERLKRGIGIASTAVSIGATVKSVKKAAKDISNVDAWKEFK